MLSPMIVLVAPESGRALKLKPSRSFFVYEKRASSRGVSFGVCVLAWLTRYTDVTRLIVAVASLSDDSSS